MAGAVVEIQDYLHAGGTNMGDGSVRIACQNNLHDMVQGITTQTQMNSIQVLRITSPGIIAILIGLLLPAVLKAREAATRAVSSMSQGSSEQGKLLPYIEQSLTALRPYFAPGAHVELRGVNVAAGDINGDGLAKLSAVFGVPVLVGATDLNGSWTGPITKATPQGAATRLKG